MKKNVTKSRFLELADGNSWAISAKDDVSSRIAQLLTETMQLDSSYRKSQHSLIIINGCSPAGQRFSGKSYPAIHSAKVLTNTDICQISSTQNNDELAIQLMKISLVVCREVEAHGGVLIHGALAEKNGAGVILAGPGDVGKTTASERLTLPWKSLSDDCTLIVRDRKGSYHAHPWPTWSTFMFGGTGGSWNVQYSVPLKAIFVLKQNPTDQAEPLGQGQAICMLNETTTQAWYVSENDLDEQKKQAMRLQRFCNLCELIKKIPAYLLHISKYGPFWKEIDRFLAPLN